MQLFQVIEGIFSNPAIPYEPAKHSLKAWATYCLRDRGFKVVYAQEADFAIETRTGEKMYFRVSTEEPETSVGKSGWLIWDQTTNQVKVIPPPSV